jgi:hypothetical protein
MEPVYKFVEQCSKEYGIDESHGLIHSKATVEWAKLLIAAEIDPVSPEETRMIFYSAALHDMCDAKYTDVEKAGQNIHDWLTTEAKWDASDADALIGIVFSTSYSKLKKQALENGGLPIYPHHGKWQRAYHIVRHADLLEAYKVRRCMLYTRHRLPCETDEGYWRIVQEVFDNRVFKYISDGWLTLPKAIEFAKVLEVQAVADLSNRVY